MTDNNDKPDVNSKSVLPAIVIATAALILLWLLDHFVLHISVLTKYRELPALSPLYAFWMPAAQPWGIVFAFLCGGLIAAAGVAIDYRRITSRQFMLGLAAAAVLLPLALFVTREPPARLGSQFLIYQGEEYYEDAVRIRNIGWFLREYVTLTPELSTHGRTHPPGNAMLLYYVGQTLGTTPLAAGVAVLLVFALAIVVTYRWLREVAGEGGARIASLLALASPSFLDFACTSMDAVFLLAAGLALWPGIVALSERGRPGHALATGSALFLAMMFSFLAFPVGLFLLIYGLARGRRSLHRNALQLGLILAGFLASALLVSLTTGFDIWDCFLVARREHMKLMSITIGVPLRSIHFQLTYGNTTAFLIGAGLAIVPLFALRLVAAAKSVGKGSGQTADPFLIATVLTGIVMCAGGLFTMETERIWLFAIPWLAGAAIGRDGAIRTTDLRWLLGAGFLQTLAMEIMFFTLW